MCGNFLRKLRVGIKACRAAIDASKVRTKSELLCDQGAIDAMRALAHCSLSSIVFVAQEQQFLLIRARMSKLPRFGV